MCFVTTPAVIKPIPANTTNLFQCFFSHCFVNLKCNCKTLVAIKPTPVTVRGLFMDAK